MAKIYESRERAALNVALYPQAGVPLDIRDIFFSINDFEAYIAKNLNYAPEGYEASDIQFLKDIMPYAYVGQVVAVVDKTNNTTTAYIITELGGDGKGYKEVGAAPVGDNKSVEVVNSAIQLNDFGVQYYKYNAEYVEGGDKPKYVLTQGWTENLTPKVVKVGDNYELAWYEPDPSTVEGLKTQVQGLVEAIGDVDTKGTIKYDIAQLEEAHNTLNDQINTGDNALATRVVTLEIAVGDADSGLVKDVEDLKEESKGLTKEVGDIQAALDESTEGTFANRIKNAESLLGDHGTRIGDLEDAVGDANGGLVKDVTDLKGSVSDLEDVVEGEGGLRDSLDSVVSSINGTDGINAKIAELQKEVGLVEGKDGLIQEVDALQEDLTDKTKDGSTAKKIATLESLVSGLSTTGLSREIVTSLESITDPKENVIYMVARPNSDWDKEKDVYDEYLYITATSSFELIGNTDVNLSNYYTKGEIDAMPHLSQEDVESIISTETNAEEGTISQAISGAISGLSQEVVANHYTKDEVDGLLGTADQVAQGYATTAEQNANSYTDKAVGDAILHLEEQLTAQDGSLKEYADGAANGAKSYADTVAGNAQTAAQGYADTEIGKLRTELQGYADTAAGNAQAAAQQFADTAAGNAQAAAQQYADGQVQAAEGRANEYAVEQAEAAEGRANSYTDKMVGGAVLELEGQISTAEQNAKDYVDDALEALGQGNLSVMTEQINTWAGTEAGDKTKSIRAIATEVAQANDYITSVAPEFNVVNKQLHLNEECVFILNGGNAAGYTIATDENELV